MKLIATIGKATSSGSN